MYTWAFIAEAVPDWAWSECLPMGCGPKRLGSDQKVIE